MIHVIVYDMKYTNTYYIRITLYTYSRCIYIYCMYIYVYIYVCIYVYIYIYSTINNLYVYIYMYIYIYMYVYIYQIKYVYIPYYCTIFYLTTVDLEWHFLHYLPLIFKATNIHWNSLGELFSHQGLRSLEILLLKKRTVNEYACFLGNIRVYSKKKWLANISYNTRNIHC